MDKPGWLIDAEEKMERSGISPEAHLALALLAGVSIRPHEEDQWVQWVASHEGFSKGTAGLLGPTREMAAFRALEEAKRKADR